MNAKQPRRVLYYGHDEDLPAQRLLKAGALSATLEEGDLRDIQVSGATILRRIYMAVRDRNWGTIPPHFTSMQIEQSERGFQIVFEAVHQNDEIDFAWRGTIQGQDDGSLEFRMDGAARKTFWRNRIGFCVLHPSELAGCSAEVEHTDGSRETAVFPIEIVPNQPVTPFGEMSAVTYEVRPGLKAEVRFEGDIFEMEDQRNWTDASYKSFCTPLRLPYPVQIPEGTRVQQSIKVKMIPVGTGAAVPLQEEAAGDEISVTIEPDSLLTMPSLGLGTASHGQPLAAIELERLAGLRLDHLRFDLRFTDPDWETSLKNAIQQASTLDTSLEVSVMPGAEDASSLSAAGQVLKSAGAKISRWLVTPSKEVFAGGSPILEAVNVCRAVLSPLFPGVPLFAGTNTDLIFLLRSRPPLELVEGVCFSINPQAHAFDNASIVETLGAQGAAVQSARSANGGLPVAVSPVTLKPRFNPYASGPVPQTPPGELPPAVDQRQLSLFAAGWTVGSISALALAGVDAATYYETTGWRGVMETQAGSSLPDCFPSVPGQVYPVYHVLADMREFAGGKALRAHTARPLRASVLALAQGPRRRLMIASHAANRQQVRIQGLPATLSAKYLDETTADSALFTPEEYRKGGWQPVLTGGNTTILEIKPFAIATLDWTLLSTEDV